MTELQGTGTCDVEAVRRPSLSLVFSKKNRDKQSSSNLISLFFPVLSTANGKNCCVDSVNIQPEITQIPTSSHKDLIMELMLGQ